MLIHKEKISGTTSSGLLSGNTTPMRGMCHSVSVQPATETTVYDIKITDSDSVDVYERLSETGTLSELLVLPIEGTYTVAVSNATVDEEFNIFIMIHE